MGFCASSVDVDFHIPPDKVPAALAAANEAVKGRYRSLEDLLGEHTSFQENQEEPEDVTIGGYVATRAGFHLGYHADKYLSETEGILHALAPFADEGSYVRFNGEDSSLWGFRVVGAALRQESVQWVIDSETR